MLFQHLAGALWPNIFQHLQHASPGRLQYMFNICLIVLPERVFSILNNTFDDDQRNAHADDIELSLQLQFNARSRAPQ